MKFDRMAPGGGAEVRCSLENGKAFLKWEFAFVPECGGKTGEEERAWRGQTAGCEERAWRGQETGCEERARRGQEAGCEERAWRGQEAGCEERARRGQAAGHGETVRVCLTDSQGNVVLEGRKALREEEPLEAVLLQPRLWRGVKDPYLYGMEAVLVDGEGRCLDKICRQLPLRNIKAAGACAGAAEPDSDTAEELLLNGEAFVPRAVRYILPCTGSEAGCQREMLADLRQMVLLGADCVCVREEGEPGRFFLQFLGHCDHFGLLALAAGAEEAGGGWVCSWDRKVKVQCGGKIPEFRGTRDSLFLPGSQCPTSLYYRYRAKWSRTPFVHLVPESLEKLESGNYAVCCYSSCSRVALYTDGRLFEFQKGDGEYVFREVPAKSPTIMLTAEGDGCITSLSVQKMLVKPGT